MAYKPISQFSIKYGPQERDNERKIIINRSTRNNYRYIRLNINDTSNLNDNSNINDILAKRIIVNINFEFEPYFFFKWILCWIYN